MKKSKLAVGLLTAVMSAGALASCDVKSSKDGVILTYVDGNGVEQKVTADELFVDYYNDSTKYQTIFDAINSIVVRNYFNKTESVTYQGVEVKLGKEQMAQIKIDAQFKVDSDKRSAKTTADNNNSSYRDEFESILTSKGVEDEEELLEKYIEEIQKNTFEDNFYKYHVDDIKLGASDVKLGDENYWNGYFKDMVPYHVSHVLIKLTDSTGTNYSNGTISDANATKLYNLVDALKDGTDSFGTIAHQFSEDEGSASNFGDLGIMDYSTGYVPEFKLGIYAYENLLAREAGVEESVIKLASSSDFTSAVDSSFGISMSEGQIPEIPFEVFKTLKENANITKDTNDKSVLEDSANFYPRNIVYNKYLNRHSVAFVTSTTAMSPEEEASHTSGFHTYSATEVPGLNGKTVLSVKVAGEWTPVLVTRAGSGNYQGIHFIVINRSPFAGTGDTHVVDGVSLNDYYTTYYPEQAGYPTKTVDDKTSPLKTYINFSSSEVSDQKSRADSLKSTLKSFNSERLNKYIFLKYFADQEIKLSDEKLYSNLMTWLERSLEKKEEEREDSWEKDWNDYIDTLRKQNTERSKLVSEACRIGYQKANTKGTQISTADYASMKAFLLAEGRTEAEIESLIGTAAAPKTYSELFKEEGGLCNDGKAHL